jgi:hypothetical protein
LKRFFGKSYQIQSTADYVFSTNIRIKKYKETMTGDEYSESKTSLFFGERPARRTKGVISKTGKNSIPVTGRKNSLSEGTGVPPKRTGNHTIFDHTKPMKDMITL